MHQINWELSTATIIAHQNNMIQMRHNTMKNKITQNTKTITTTTKTAIQTGTRKS